MAMQIIAFYLPQFHSIEENDKWWGKGFTEWSNVKKAQPLRSDHNQPRIPLNQNYYNLLDKDVRQWQGEIAKKYGIYGFCYYHYWFKGKLLLERPLELMLTDGEPNIPFCLSWANEPWTRAWDGKNYHVLMPQNYGGEEDWESHFRYLLRFFKDERYIKVDNKPLFLIYRLDKIDNFREMFSFWNKMATQYGFDGIFISQIMNSFNNEHIDGVNSRVILEPMNTVRFQIPFASLKQIINKGKALVVRKIYRSSPNTPNLFLHTAKYDYIWKIILERKIPTSPVPVFPGAFVDWDNTPRRGAAGFFVEGASPEKFEVYLTLLIEKAKKDYKTDMIFINAWNEWGEGAYLEPDTLNKYGYLEAIRNALKKDAC